MMRTTTILLCALFCPTLVAAQDDPDIPWMIQESPHFIIHYPASRNQFASRTLSIAEEAYDRLTPLLKWTPREKTNISVIDTLDTANGWARTITNNHIRVYTYPPSVSSELGDYDDWMRQLIYHEYTHILHMDTAGLPHHVVDLIFGKFAKYNTVMPTWYTEGLAVYYESYCSDSGRLRNTIYRTMIRNAALNNTIPSFSKLSMGISSWPGAAAQYLYGSYFIGYIANRYGQATLTEWNHRYGNRIVPFFLNITAKNIWNKSWNDLYEEWRTYEIQRANEELDAAKAQGELTPHESLIPPHRHSRPQIIPNSSDISYVHSDGYHIQSIVRYDPISKNKKDIVQCSGDCEHHWNSDGSKLYFIHTTAEDGYRLRDRLFMYDTQTQREANLNLPDHVRTFAIDKDDTLYWVVQSNESNIIYKRSPDQLFEQIYKSRPFEQIDDIHVSDSRITAAIFDPGTRQYDIEWLELSDTDTSGGGIIQRHKVTDSKSPDMSPYFCSENSICYVSAQNDALNLYQYKISTNETIRMTHLLDGIVHPVEDHSGNIYYTQYTSSGKTIARIYAKDLITHPVFPDKRTQEQTYPELLGVSTDLPSHELAYQWLFPRRWTPLVNASQEMGWAYGINFWGHDEIDHHSYNFSTQYLPKKNAFDVSFDYLRSSLPWTIGLNLSLTQNISSYFDTQKMRQFDYQTFSTSLSGSRTINQRLSTHQITLQYLLQYSEARDPLSWNHRDPAASPVRLPSLGYHNALVLSWAWSNRRQTELAFTTNYGTYLSSAIRFEAPWLGADNYAIIWNFTWLQSITMPYLNSHTLNTKASVGLSWSRDNLRMPFTISSNLGYVFNTSGIDSSMHGYPIGSIYGKNDFYLHIDYTAMLFDIEYAYSTFPVGIDRIALSPFADWAYAWNNTFDITKSKFDIGCKLYLDLVMAYRYTFRLALGYGWGGSDTGGHELFFYWQMRE